MTQDPNAGPAPVPGAAPAQPRAKADAPRPGPARAAPTAAEAAAAPAAPRAPAKGAARAKVAPPPASAAEILDAPAPGGAAPQAEPGAGAAADGATPPFVIRDRRFWAREDQGEVDGAPAPADAAAADAAPPPAPSPIELLEQQLADKEERLQGTLRQYKEARDEFEAARARLRRDVQKDVEAGKRAIIAGLLDVLDNLDRAVETARADGGAAESALLSGVTMVRDQFLAKLEAVGVRRLDGTGQPFDPQRFEAVSLVPVTDAAQDGVIVGVVRTCYLMGEETLRHGMAAVGKAG